MGAYGLSSRSTRQRPMAVFHGGCDESSLSVSKMEFIDSLRIF
jgi:hypothetical protein